MTQEEKQLLLVDLCMRLPYGVIVETYWEFENKKEKTFPKTKLTHEMFGYYIGEDKWKYNTHFLPFLRPMSSMTEEEKEHLQALHDVVSDENYGDGYSPAAWEAISEFNDYCHAHHLDNRGLIGKGLALKAPEHMYD